MVNGVRPTTFTVLPMLGHHPDSYPRFRDCFVGDAEHPEHAKRIVVYTRTGGGNREDYATENDWIRSLPGFVCDYDDSFDNTFACWVFDVPERWKADFDKIMTGKAATISAEYKEEMCRVYPKLKDQFKAMWAETSTEE